MASSPPESTPAEPATPATATSSGGARFTWKWLTQGLGLFQRERDRIRAEIQSFHGLMPLLMQQRNGTCWTADERAQLSQHLRRLTSLSPYLLALLAPGSVVLLPLLAWWLDRRRKRRNQGGREKASAVRLE